MISASRSSFLATAALGMSAAPIAVRAQAATKLRMAGVFSDSFGEPYYAKDAGAFAKAGFDVETTTLVNAGAAVAALGGSLDLAIGDLVSGVNAILKGVPIVLVAGSGMYRSADGSVIMAVAKDSPIHGPRDLAGKIIGVPTLVGLTTACVRAWLTQAGVDLATVKMVEIPQGAVVPGLQRGTVDCALLGEPFITPSKNDVRDVGRPYDVAAKEFCISVWYASKPWIEADRERARKIVGAIYDTGRWANTHQAETFGILVRDGHLDGEKMKGMIRIAYATSLPTSYVQPVLNVATQAGIFDRPVDANALILKV